jgi:hypothetical protein
LDEEDELVDIDCARLVLIDFLEQRSQIGVRDVDTEFLEHLDDLGFSEAALVRCVGSLELASEILEEIISLGEFFLEEVLEDGGELLERDLVVLVLVEQVEVVLQLLCARVDADPDQSFVQLGTVQRTVLVLVY